MKTLISQSGTIGNDGGIQPDGLLLPDFSMLDPGAAPVLRIATATAPPAAGLTSMASSAGLAPATAQDISAVVPGTISSSAGIAVSPSNSAGFAPLLIVPIFGSTILNLTGGEGNPTAAQVEGAINAAINYYNTTWTSSVPVVFNNGTISNTVTVSIQFDYGQVNGTLLPGGLGAPAARSSYGLSPVDGGYAALSGVLTNLPLIDPTGGGDILETSAQSQLFGAVGSAPAGYVGLNTFANGVTFDYTSGAIVPSGQVDAVGAIEHEISEIFGRVADLGNIPHTYSILDLYRYSAPNTPALSAGPLDYFSLDSGTTVAGYFNDSTNLGDSGDWASSGPNNIPLDAFDAFLTTGSNYAVSTLDASVLANLGFQAACYLEGTRILTDAGERPIETLSVGDELRTILGGSGRVIWLGRRAVDLTRHPNPRLAWPVRVSAGAFGVGCPTRDLFLSPDHAVFTGGVLIPVRLLINGTTIQQTERAQVVYYHVELQRHDVILAEGLPAESYMENGDRSAFSGGVVITLHPDFVARRWEMEGCAPLVLTGPLLEDARQRLNKPIRRLRTAKADGPAPEFRALSRRRA
jgi:hypothetical protein